jgi:hypothetical protein
MATDYTTLNPPARAEDEARRDCRFAAFLCISLRVASSRAA